MLMGERGFLGFDECASETDLGRMVNLVTFGGIEFVTGLLAGSTAIRCNSSACDFVFENLNQGSNLQTYGFRIRNEAILPSIPFFTAQDSGGLEQWHLEYVAAVGGYRIELYRGATLITTTNTLFNNGQWYYIELQVTTDDAPNGTVEFRVDRSTDFSFTNQDLSLQNSTEVDQLAFHIETGSPGVYQYLDDIYFLDSSGSDNIGFLGPQRVDYIPVNADAPTSEWTPSTGASAAAMISEAIADDDATYIFSNTANATSLFSLAALAGISGTINAIRFDITARLENVSTRDVQPIYRNSIQTEAVFASVSVDAATYKTFSTISEINPLTLIKWTSGNLSTGTIGKRLI